MTVSIDKSLTRLREVIPKLNKAADEAALVVQEVERTLAELGAGITAEVEVSFRQKTPKIGEHILLACRRVQSSGKAAFRVVVVERQKTEFKDVNDNEAWADEDKDVTPWSECARDIKLATFPKLPELLAQMIGNADEAYSYIVAAQQVTRTMLNGSM